jgi:hypothetical protein
MFNNLFSYKLVPFMRYCGKIVYSRADHMAIWYGAGALHVG